MCGKSIVSPQLWRASCILDDSDIRIKIAHLHFKCIVLTSSQSIYNLCRLKFLFFNIVSLSGDHALLNPYSGHVTCLNTCGTCYSTLTPVPPVELQMLQQALAVAEEATLIVNDKPSKALSGKDHSIR